MSTYVSKFTGAQIDQRLEMAEQVPNKANKSELPSKVSDLVNDSGFISETQKITGGGASKTVSEMLVQTVENTTAINTEKSRAEEAEGALGNAINTERTRAQGAEQNNANAIATEKSRAEGAEAAMNAKISALEASKYKVVAVLPATGETNVIYLVPSPRPSQKNIKDEFIWVDGAWEQIGSTEIDLSDYAHKGEVRHIERDLGMYPELEPTPLNSETTGKYINSEGKYIDASGWNVASIGAVSLGNTYLLNMVSSANMVLGVALFVSRVYKRDKEGKVIGTTLTPLFSAKDTRIPASGYVLFEASDDYDEVLVCYKPALATEMLVARWGFKASHATQMRNLRLLVDNKTDFEGIYELLTAGYSLNLVGKGIGEPQAFMSRKTGGGNITDGSAVIKEVDGVQPIVWNQRVVNGNFKDNGSGWESESGVTVTYSSGYAQIVTTANRNGIKRALSSPQIVGHKYLFMLDYSAERELVFRFNLGFEANFPASSSRTNTASVVTCSSVLSGVTGLFFSSNPSGTESRFSVWGAQVIDLTQMFGAGNEPSTYEEYLERISHYHIEDAYAYNEGEIVNYKGTGIKTTGRNLWDEKWESGFINAGGDQYEPNSIRSKNYMPCQPNTTYFKRRVNYPNIISMVFYDINKNMLERSFNDDYSTSPSNAAYFRISMYGYGTTYKHDICINLSDASFNGQYEPYKSYVRDWSAVMRKFFPDGMTSLNGVKDFFNERKAVRKWGVKVFNGTESWRGVSENGKFYLVKAVEVGGTSAVSNGYLNTKQYPTLDQPYGTFHIRTDGEINIADSAYASVNEWKSHLADLYAAGTPLVIYYELAEPVEDIFEKPLNLAYTVIDGGMETSLANENSTQFEGSVAYNKDYVAVVDELQLQNRVITMEFENWEN